MKVKWIVNSINQIGGVERVVCNLSSYFTNENNWDVEIISLSTDSSDIFFDIDSKVKITHLNWNRHIIQNKSEFNKRIGLLMKQLDSDILITCHSFISIPVCLNKNKFKGKIIVTEHGDFHSYTLKRKLLNVFVYRFADRLIVLTRNNQNIYKKLGIKRCYMIPNGIEITYKKGIKLDKKRIVALGRLSKEKGFDILVAAMVNIAKEFPEWKLVIVGDGEERENLNYQIKDLNLESNIQIVGSTRDIYKYFEESSIFVLSSRTEAFPLTLLEAMSCGMAIVSTNIPGPSEMLCGVCKEFVTIGDSFDLSEKIRELICNQDTRVKMGEKTLKKVQEYSLKRINQQWKIIINRLQKEE